MSNASGRKLLAFLGSMHLAIILLVAVALASIIGTVLQQNQPYGDYLIKFGPFWFDIFRVLGLYDVYSSWWFLIILAFLVVSTSACVIRNTPNMLRDMRDHRVGVQEKSLRAMPDHAEWVIPMSAEAAAIEGRSVLTEAGFALKERRAGSGYLLAGRRGTWQRIGYIFTHVSIVIILIGGVMDSRIWLALREMKGDLVVETRSVPLSQVPAQSVVSSDNPSFRGNVNIPEGEQSSVLFLNVRDGYVIQELPFSIEVKDFRIEHYINGQPKSFESDLVIHDPAYPDQPLEQTIWVNKPLIYKGYAIYQASFGDGGTKLSLRSWQLKGQTGEAQNLRGAIFQNIPFTLGGQRYTLELNDFRLFNINPVEGENGESEQMNFGPSMVFRLRDEAGQAREYENFMSPVVMDGRPVFVSGVRERLGEQMHYLYLPADRDSSLQTFMDFYARLHDPEQVARVVDMMLEDINPEAARMPAAHESIRNLVNRFVEAGYDGVGRDLEQRVSQDQLEQAFQTSVRVLQTALGRMFMEMMRARGIDRLDQFDERFLADAVAAINALPFYGSPIYLQMTNFEHIQASGLQIAKSPGTPVVYFGSLMLTLGIFMLFYLNPRRAWIMVREEAGGSRLLLATTTHRKSLDMQHASTALFAMLNARLHGATRVSEPLVPRSS